MYIKLSGENINFDDKKFKKVNFTKAKEHFRKMTLILIKC